MHDFRRGVVSGDDVENLLSDLIFGLLSAGSDVVGAVDIGQTGQRGAEGTHSLRGLFGEHVRRVEERRVTLQMLCQSTVVHYLGPTRVDQTARRFHLRQELAVHHSLGARVARH